MIIETPNGRFIKVKMDSSTEALLWQSGKVYGGFCKAFYQSADDESEADNGTRNNTQHGKPD